MNPILNWGSLLLLLMLCMYVCHDQATDFLVFFAKVMLLFSIFFNDICIYIFSSSSLAFFFGFFSFFMLVM